MAQNSTETLATEMTRAEMASTVFDENVLLGLITGRNTQESKLGRPGSMAKLAAIAKEGNKGAQRILQKKTGSFAKVRFQTQTQGGSANVARGSTPDATGATPTVTRTSIQRVAKFGWTKLITPIEVPDSDIVLNQGPEAQNHGDTLQTYVQSGTEDHGDQLVSALYSGFPSSQSVDTAYWTNPIGMKFAIYDGETTTTDHLKATHKLYGGVDRSDDDALNANFQAGFFGGTAVQFSFALIDAVNKAAAAKKGKGINTVLVNTDLFYDKVIPMSKVEGAQYVTYNKAIPQFGIVSFRQDHVQYRNCIITHDPQIAAGTEGGTSQMFCLILQDWHFDVHPTYDFTVAKLIHLGVDTKLGDVDVHQTSIATLYRWYCTKPARQGYYADVS